MTDTNRHDEALHDLTLMRHDSMLPGEVAAYERLLAYIVANREAEAAHDAEVCEVATVSHMMGAADANAANRASERTEAEQYADCVRDNEHKTAQRDWLADQLDKKNVIDATGHSRTAAEWIGQAIEATRYASPNSQVGDGWLLPETPYAANIPECKGCKERDVDVELAGGGAIYQCCASQEADGNPLDCPYDVVIVRRAPTPTPESQPEASEVEEALNRQHTRCVANAADRRERGFSGDSVEVMADWATIRQALTTKATENERLRGEVDRLLAEYNNALDALEKCDAILEASEQPTPELVTFVEAATRLRQLFNPDSDYVAAENFTSALTAFLATPQGKRVAETMGGAS